METSSPSTSHTNEGTRLGAEESVEPGVRVVGQGLLDKGARPRDYHTPISFVDLAGIALHPRYGDDPVELVDALRAVKSGPLPGHGR